MTVRDEVQVEVGEQPAVAAPAPGRPAFGSFRLLQVVLFGLTVAGVVIGWRITVPGGIAPANSVAFGLTLAWALVGIVDTRARDRVGTKASPFHLLAAVDALVAAVALAAGRKAEMVHASSSARDVATLAAIVVTAISFHFLLALPDGRLHDSVRRVMAVERLRGGRRRRPRVRRGPPAVQPRRRRDQLVHRGSAGDRTDAQPATSGRSGTTGSGWSGSASA